MRNIFLLLIVSLTLFFKCKNKSEAKQNESKEVDTIPNVVTSSQQQSALKVSAYLIYDDGTVSDFDVLNDKSIALWNTVIGSGDALKPSNSTRVNLTGNLDSLNIKIINGHKLVVDTIILHSDRDVNYIIENTGCDEVDVKVIKSKKDVYNDTIPFHCGE